MVSCVSYEPLDGRCRHWASIRAFVDAVKFHPCGTEQIAHFRFAFMEVENDRAIVAIVLQATQPANERHYGMSSRCHVWPSRVIIGA